MLYTAVRDALNEGALVSRDAWRPLPRFEDREAWRNVDPQTRAYFEGAAPMYKNFALPALPAARYMDFCRDGNRSRFEHMYFERRRALYTLAFAQCLAGDARYMDDIANLVWAICEETSWVVPAHNNFSARIAAGHVNALADAEEDPPYIDLFAAETGSLLSWVSYLLGESLNALSPMLARRIACEVNRRVLVPYLARDDFNWMGLANEEKMNNWNPWVNSNVLACMLILEGDPEKRSALALKIAKSADRFLAFYAPDGGCDEGPSYFNVAGASMLDILELYDLATGGRADIYAQPLIRNMARYIMYAHISGRYYVNFADAPARVCVDGMLLLRAARRMGLCDLEAFAQAALAGDFAAKPYEVNYSVIYRRLQNALSYRARDFEGKTAPDALSHAFEGIQVAFARAKETGEGLYFAAKGGNNGESHNHNDAGNYVIYLDGEPVVCDAGVETYRRQTFSAERYGIWTMQSRYHNTAILNDCDQHPGAEYAARDFHFEDAGNAAVFRADLAGAYGEEARVARYAREIRLNRAENEITVSDEYALTECASPVQIPILLAAKPRLAPGEVQIPAGKRTACLRYDSTLFTASVAPITLTDEKLQKDWGRPALYRLLLTRTDLELQGKFTLTYRG